LGGWLVAEPWIKPSLLTHRGVGDEWSFTAKFAHDPATLNELVHHWNTWITEEDIRFVSSAGITHVRIPVGFWMFLSTGELRDHGEPYVTGSWPYLVRCLGWLKKHGVKAIVDLHGAPGSQNEWPHNGHAGSAKWGTGDTVERTLDIVEEMARRIQSLEDDPRYSGTVAGLALLNEPQFWVLSGGLDVVRHYWIQAYGRARKHLDADRFMLIIDGAYAEGAWNGFMPAPKYKNVYLDLHIYQCFSESERAWSTDKHIQQTCEDRDRKQIAQQTLPVLVGEWSLAWKSEMHAGEPYPDSGQRDFMRRFFLAQADSYSRPASHGYFFWTLKTENHIAPMWDFTLGVQRGWIPTPLAASAGSGCEPAPRRSPRAPYPTLAHPIPGKFQVENFDRGGEGVAYHDHEKKNLGGRYRLDHGVDIKTATDKGAGFYVGWTKAGEWLKYTVNVKRAGRYQILMRVASNGKGGSFSILWDNVVVATATVPNTHGWQKWATISLSPSKRFTKGKHSLTIRMNHAGPTGTVGNINWIDFRYVGA
jgi:glucan 1,3-beta-glucosidase